MNRSPGVVLREGTFNGDVVTTFTFEPLDNGTRTRLTILYRADTFTGLERGHRALAEPSHPARGISPRIGEHQPIHTSDVMITGRTALYMIL